MFNKSILVPYVKPNLFWLLVVSIIFRTSWQDNNFAISYNIDTASYCYAAKRISNLIIDEFRPPVYPIVINLCTYINKDDPFSSIVLFQNLLSFLSIIPFYLICRQWFQIRSLAFFSALTYACLPDILKYNNAIYPESLMISSFVFLLYLFSSYIRFPKPWKSFSIGLFLFYLVMLKPVCLFIYGVLAIIGAVGFISSNKVNKRSLMAFSPSILLILFYCQVNKQQNDFFGVSTVTRDNNLINVILSKAYKEISDNKLVSTIDTLKNRGHYYKLYYLNNDNRKHDRNMGAFPIGYPYTQDMDWALTIPENQLGYNANNLAPLISKAMISERYLLYIGKLFLDFNFTQVLFFKGYLVYVLFGIETLLLLNVFSLKREEGPFRLFVLAMAIGIVMSALIGGVNDMSRSRVLLPIAPFLIFMLFIVIDKSLSNVVCFLKSRNLLT